MWATDDLAALRCGNHPEQRGPAHDRDHMTCRPPSSRCAHRHPAASPHRNLLGLQNITDHHATDRRDAVIIGYGDLAAHSAAPAAQPAGHWVAIRDTVLLAAWAAGIHTIHGPFLRGADDERSGTPPAWAPEVIA